MTSPDPAASGPSGPCLDDAQAMSRAIELARRGLYTTDPNPRVGCVIVNDGAIVGEGWHVRAGEAHAEIHALRAAGPRARGATAVVTLEPCCHHGRTPPCTDALVAAGVARVVVGMVDPNPRVAGQGLAALAARGVAVTSGVLAADAEALNPGFAMRMRQGRPWVRLKQAMSLDGRTALATGESQWITGEAARRDVHRWRARASAVMAGGATVIHDDARLNVRLAAEPSEGTRQPLRVVLDPDLALPAAAQVLHVPGPVLLLAGEGAVASTALAGTGVPIEWVGRDRHGLDLAAVMAVLARHEVNELHVEAGARLAASLLRAGLVDEWLLYVAPVMLGAGARGLVALDIPRMSEGVAVDVLEQRAVGADWRLTLRPRATTGAAGRIQ